ncbi:cytochrome c oxidase, subunit VIb [Lentinula detonsa]|uniref:Cytochrome c oxidase subunit n=1 Tax=Lentinula detonsa TaxID=2804962 RepID=A0A9W8NZX6_9AGAR|nr:cytochrome c oxidase, subunit VIb [Lentinula detonsa]KAJ3985604.1 cytochrome c oxidase, subunit VIb [Lentinula detonsa]
MSDSESDIDIADLRSKYVLKTVPFDARFPNQNQTRHCFQTYIDYHKCVKAKGEDFAPCQQFLQAYRALCPHSWTEKWDGQREAGTFPASLEP